jgi:serine/threonine transporter
MEFLKSVVKKYTETSLIIRIVIGLVIGVIQDSVETMLNSSGDVMFAATAEYATWIKEGREDALPTFLGGKRKVEV